MFQVIAEAANGYVGCSERLARQYEDACRSTGRRFETWKRDGSGWHLVAESN